MPDETQNHGLLIYSIGEENWTHTPDIETIEQRLPIGFDIEANLGEYEPHQGAMFIDQESGKVFDGDGAAWNHAERDFLRAYEEGNRLATRNYVDTEISNIDTSGGAPEIHGNDYHDPDFASVGDLDAHSTTNANVHGVGDSGIASNADIQAALDQHVQDYEHGGGDGGATEQYVDDQIDLHAGIVDAHHSRYTDSEARSAVDGSNVTVENSVLWDGYELVPNDQEPETNKYIRLETEE